MMLEATLPGSTTTSLPIADCESVVPFYSDREVSLETLDLNSMACLEEPTFDVPSVEEDETRYDFYSKFKEVLRPKQWMVFHCYYREGYTQDAIAEMFGVTQQLVSKILRASEARIRRKLGPLVKGFFDYKNRRSPQSDI